MALVNHNINNMAGGVSQQPDESRFDNQVESMDNFMVTAAQGLRRRNPVAQVNTTARNHTDTMAVHSYDRGDGLNKYGMIVDNDGLRIFDEAGNPKTVNIVGGTDPIAQWGSTDWSTNIQFLTVGDTTWVLNKNMVIRSSLEAAEERIDRAFYWIKKSFDNGQDEGYTYQVVLDGITHEINSTDTIAAIENVDVSNPVLPEKHGLLKKINDISMTTRIFAKNSGSILTIVKGSMSSVAETIGGTAYSAIPIAPAGYKYIRVATDTNGTNAGYHDITDGTGRYEAYNKMINGGAMYTTSGWVDAASMSWGVSGSHEYALVNVQYYKDNDYSLYGSTTTRVVQRYNDGNTFTFESGDSWGNQASVGWKDSVSKISNLPSSMDGFTNEEVGTIAITGTDKDSFTNYYLSWEDDHWKETYEDGTKMTLDKLTLPAKIVQIDDDTFELGFNDDWIDRVKGDEDSNPAPSFIDYTISNMFFFKNRLGFTSEENVILSETGYYYNFFATTVMEVLDSDPIDAGVDSNTVSVIRNVNATAGALTLWADNAQFLLSGGEILSPATTRISQTSSYACDNGLSPLVVDNEIIYFNKKGSSLEALSYAPASLQADKSSAESISAHVPTYLPSTISSVKIASAYNMMFLVSGSNSNTIYVYKYHIQGGAKVLSAWFKWNFADTIRAIEVLNNKLFVLANDRDILSLELEPQNIEENFLDKGTVSYDSSVIMSKYNVSTQQGTQTIREPFYVKNIKVSRQGKVDFDIINEERNSTTTVASKHLDRKLVVGGNSSKVKTGFSTSYDTGCQIDTVSIEGRLQSKSRNV
jgi:hypothetical protein